MDFIRPMLMPVLVVLIVSTVWVMSWVKQMDAQMERAGKPTVRALYVAQSDGPDEFEPPAE